MISCKSGICPELQACDHGLLRYRDAVAAGRLDADGAPHCLVNLGLLEAPQEGADHLIPVPPPAAAARVLRPHEQEVAALNEVVRTLSATFESAEANYIAAKQGQLPDMVILRGARMINQVIDATVSNCRTELMTAQPGGSRPESVLEELIARSLETIRRGVRQRTLYQHAVRAHGPTFDYILQVTEAGAEVRTVDEMFDRLIICDRSVAYIPTSSADEEEAMEIRNPAVVRFLVNVFEHTWDRGIIVDLSARRPQSVVTDMERSVARMLVFGSTEDKIARDLGVSRRTVAGYASRLARRLGSKSRAQLGYLVATSGLLEESPEPTSGV